MIEASTVRVLIVDDYANWGQFMTRLLRVRPGWHVVGTASDGRLAVDMVKELQPEVVLMEVRLPALSGIEAAQQILQIAPRTKIVFVSDYQDADVVKAVLTAGGAGYVFKFVVHKKLLPGMEAVLSGKWYVSSGVKGINLTEIADA